MSTRAVIALLVVAIGVVYANSLNNGFHLDDSYGLVDNPAIRELSNIPKYFQDPRTLTLAKSNAEYRPILQMTYALNYAISEYRPWSWHVVNLLLHGIVCLALFLLGRHLLGSARASPLSWLDAREGDLVSAGAALLFAVHPIGSGCANYMWARSTLLVSAFILPATVLHLRAISGSRRALAGAYLLYVLALFTKVEAISFLAIAGLAEALMLLTSGDERTRASRVGAAAARLFPYAVLGGAYMVLRERIVPDWVEAARHEADMTPYFYFVTQLRVWWLYVSRMIAPLDIITDDKGYPVSHSILEPAVVLAGVGWVLVGALLSRAVRSAPVVAFLGIAFFIHLSPHSSVAPLAEMHNEHRPYLATTSLFLLASLGIVLVSRAAAPGYRRIPVLVIGALAIAYGALTVERNHVWLDDETFWGDIVTKAPKSTRAHVNWGILKMSRGEFTVAEASFREAIRLAPFYYVAHINLGICRDAQGDVKEGTHELDEAVRVMPSEPAGWYWRGAIKAKHGDLKGGAEDMLQALSLDERDVRTREHYARVLAQLGRIEEAKALTFQGYQYDRPRFEKLMGELPGLVPPPGRRPPPPPPSVAPSPRPR